MTAAHLTPKLPDGLPFMWAAPVGEDAQLWHKSAALLLPVVQGGGWSDYEEGTPNVLHLEGVGWGGVGEGEVGGRVG